MSTQPQPDDSGPAFPCATDRVIVDPKGEQVHIEMRDGMSLRDWFAGQADPRQVYGECDGDLMPTAVARALNGRDRPNYDTDPLGNAAWWSEAVARWKYLHADAMLSARKAGGQ